MLQQEVVERDYQFRLVADESIRKVISQYLAAVAVKARLPRELQHLPLQLCTAVQQARDRRHHTSLQTSVEHRLDAIRERSTATCGTPIDECPPRLRYEWVGLPSHEPNRREPLAKNTRRQQVQLPRLTTGWPRPALLDRCRGTARSPGVEVAAERGWCDARRVEDLEALWRGFGK